MKTKDLLVLSAFATLAACSGGGGSSGGSDSEVLPPETVTEPTSPEGSGAGDAAGLYTVTEDNYVAVASALYSATTSAIVLTSVGQELPLTQIKSATEVETTRACDISGQLVTQVERTPFADKTIHAKDRIVRLYQSCKQNNGIEDDGLTSIYIQSMSGSYGSDNYVIRLDDHLDLTRTGAIREELRGDYRHHLLGVLAAKGEVSLSGVNLSTLYRGILPDTGTSEFAEVIGEEISHGEVYKDPIYYTTPEYSFDTFAFELIRDESAADLRVKYRWLFDSTYRLDASGNHVARTVRQLILEERTIVDPEDGSTDKVQVAIEGEFAFDMDSGQTISVQVFPGDSVEVVLDSDADGAGEKAASMSWAQFQAEMFKLMPITEL